MESILGCPGDSPLIFLFAMPTADKFVAREITLTPNMLRDMLHEGQKFSEIPTPLFDICYIKYLS